MIVFLIHYFFMTGNADNLLLIQLWTCWFLEFSWTLVSCTSFFSATRQRTQFISRRLFQCTHLFTSLVFSIDWNHPKYQPFLGMVQWVAVSININISNDRDDMHLNHLEDWMSLDRIESPESLFSMELNSYQRELQILSPQLWNQWVFTLAMNHSLWLPANSN